MYFFLAVFGRNLWKDQYRFFFRFTLDAICSCLGGIKAGRILTLHSLHYSFSELSFSSQRRHDKVTALLDGVFFLRSLIPFVWVRLFESFFATPFYPVPLSYVIPHSFITHLITSMHVFIGRLVVQFPSTLFCETLSIACWLPFFVTYLKHLRLFFNFLLCCSHSKTSSNTLIVWYVLPNNSTHPL